MGARVWSDADKGKTGTNTEDTEGKEVNPKIKTETENTDLTDRTDRTDRTDEDEILVISRLANHAIRR